MNPWQRIDSKTVYRNPWITVREDTVVRPDGSPGIYGVVVIRPSVGVLAINDRDEVALVSQWRYVHSRMSLEIPTGGSEEGEDVLSAAKRELAEETGLTAVSWTSLGSIDNSNGVTTDTAHIYMAQGLTPGTAHHDADESLELKWLPMGDVLAMVMKGNITESVSVAAILKAAMLRQNS